MKEIISTAGENSGKSGSDFLLNLVDEHKELLEERFSLLNSTNISNYEENFIHMLFKHGKTDDIIQFVTKFGKENKETLVKLLNQENKIEWIPIYYIPQHKSEELIKLVHNFDKSQVKHIWKSGSVLFKAAEVLCPERDGSSLKCLKFLIEELGLNINQTDNEGCTPLYMAWYKYNYEIIKYLLESGADPSILGTNGSTPLHIWAERDFLDILQLLWAKRSDLVYLQDNEGNTPLHVASIWSHMEIVEFLWQEGGKKLASIKNSDGLTAMELAYEENQLHPHEFLCEKMGIKPNSLWSIL